MAYQVHLDILLWGREAWNEWRKEHPALRPDHSRASLRGSYLGKVYLSEANLSEANLRGANLFEADRIGANLSEAHLRGIRLNRAMLTDVVLTDADLLQAILSQADLLQAKLRRANLTKADLRKANLTASDLRRAHLNKADLSEADPRGANLSGAQIYRACVSRANLSEAHLNNATLILTNLTNVNLSGAHLYGANLSDQEEQALVAAVTETGSLRDRTIIILMLHTGLRAREVCTLTRSQVALGKRGGTLQVLGKRNKYREIPLNGTARAALAEYDATQRKQSSDPTPLFLSEKTQRGLTERGLGYLIKKYAELAKVQDLSPHDLRHRMAASVPLNGLAQIMGHDSLDTTLMYVRGTKADLQQEIEKIAWT